ncbi:Uu.00g020380.m01.CDS01 [Anthostomella pinea]|uniref:Uu.00g020380.m01.CDS01 n=1 Tax=Anthostomella pinea TaxID=933095 RepID=A0AAI8W039_9PEZI|nr:Uu.00g020380.m01.CDS01 [Anthostomella pinea]
MAVQTSLPALLDTLTNSLSSALEATPKLAGIKPTADNVSLLDVKNELLLSYLQNLVFLILLKIRNAKKNHNATGSDAGSAADDNASELSDAVVKKLVELRLYLDKGVRPLEEKLRFQLDKMLRAADDADRNQRAAQEAKDAESSESESDSGSDKETGDGVGEEGGKPAKPSFGFAPSFNNFAKAAAPVGMAAAATQDKTGVYRPPKITPTVMPTTERREPRDRRPLKSATMDEYIKEDMSSIPLAQPSVGTTIVDRGRKVKTATERAEEDRKRDYEETNFVRLPKESKKDRAKKSRNEGGGGKMNFGGEDWRDLGEGVDRIERLTRRKEGGGGGTKALLEKSRKRGRDTADSGRGSGLSSGMKEMGERFNKKVKVMEGGRRDRGKR